MPLQLFLCADWRSGGGEQQHRDLLRTERRQHTRTEEFLASRDRGVGDWENATTIGSTKLQANESGPISSLTLEQWIIPARIVSVGRFAGRRRRGVQLTGDLDRAFARGDVRMQTAKASAPLEIQVWPIDRFVLYARNPRKNDAVVDRMCSSIREFGFTIPVLARSDDEVVDGHLRIKAARKLRIEQIPVILCDEWTAAQVKAFRLMVNRSVSWASWEDELLALELQELSEADFDLSLSGFDPGEIDALLVDPEDEERANAAPPLPENPVSRTGDLWLCGSHRVLCGDATKPEMCPGCWATA